MPANMFDVFPAMTIVLRLGSYSFLSGPLPHFTHQHRFQCWSNRVQVKIVIQ